MRRGDGGCCIIIILVDGARHFLITKFALSHPVHANNSQKVYILLPLPSADVVTVMCVVCAQHYIKYVRKF